jgi:hypothetical protein
VKTTLELIAALVRKHGGADLRVLEWDPRHEHRSEERLIVAAADGRVDQIEVHGKGHLDTDGEGPPVQIGTPTVCPHVCADCAHDGRAGQHHWREESLDPDDPDEVDELVENFRAEIEAGEISEAQLRSEEFLLGFYECAHCMALAAAGGEPG